MEQDQQQQIALPLRPRASTANSSLATSSRERTVSSLFRVRFLMLLSAAYAILFVLLCTTHPSTHTFGVVGFAIGFLSCSAIFVNAFKTVGLLQRPLSLLIYKSGVDMIVAARFLWSPVIDSHSHHCNAPSVLLTFCELASQAWIFCIAWDLWSALSNPFTLSALQLRLYHAFSWGIATLGSLSVLFTGHAYGMFLGSWCWWRTSNKRMHLQAFAWGMFYIPVGGMMLASLLVCVVSAWHLRHGLGKTFLQRARVVTAYACFLLLLLAQWSLYAGLYLVRDLVEDLSARNSSTLANALLFVLASQGFVDLLAWLMTSHFAAETTSISSTSSTCSTCNASTTHTNMNTNTNSYSNSHNHMNSNISIGHNHDGASNDPAATSQANEALQTEFVSYVTRGIIGAFNQTQVYPQGDPCEAVNVPLPRQNSYQVAWKHIWKHRFNFRLIKEELDSMDPEGADAHFVAVPSMFQEFCPHSFQRVRIAFEVTAALVSMELRATLKHRFTQGGASGAIFFYSHSSKFIVKSISKADAKFWTKKCAGLSDRTNAQAYAEYMESHHKTLLTKIFGVFELRLYGTSFYIMMMENIFRQSGVARIHEIYDLKGSWVNRSAELPEEGSQATCLHCNTKFTYSRNRIEGQGCGSHPVHQPRNVGKDNDLRYRICVQDPSELISLLEQDTTFLCDVFQNMDYSLLVGVHLQDHPTNVEGVSGLRSSCLVAPTVRGPSCFFLGVIDILQPWSLSKRTELFLKTVTNSGKAAGISSQPPHRYRIRFMHAMRRYVRGAGHVCRPSGSLVGFRHILDEDEIDGMSSGNDMPVGANNDDFLQQQHFQSLTRFSAGTVRDLMP
eukprot:c10986_g1_i1.p1 GENE.c10986_g1_i1~~c10986_g1_i1.p1  ORF type:complete len:849 (-),score=183.12 c10986_g1_i1:55-2580(-)